MTIIPKQIITFKQLLAEGLSETEIKNMYAKLKLFPTPFKGIYYAPSEDERKAHFIDKPLRVLYRSLPIFLKSDNFYFSCKSAEEEYGIDWHPSGVVHIVNDKLSKKISLKKRILRNGSKNTWRAKKLSKLLSFYGNELIFHKVRDLKGIKTMQTPYGRFALRSQIKKDKKRFGES